MVRRCAWSRNLVNEKAMAHWGAVAPKTTCIQKMFRGTLGSRGRLSGVQEEHFPIIENGKYNLVT